MGTARAFWRSLTSMRTALILLLLLAVAAIPGSVLPQRNLSPEKVNAYLAAHPEAGPWLDRLGFFEVFASPWFSAIYLLLFISLLGCLVPRLRQHVMSLMSAPPDAPARLDRLPQSVADLETDGDPVRAGAALRVALRRQRWRVVVRNHDDGTVTVAAEKGYLKETGNLVFHFALLAVLVGVALGSWYGWHGNRLVVAGRDFGFCNTLQQYDEYGLGGRVGAGDLPPFCVTLNDFRAEYLGNGQPVTYTADISYVKGIEGAEQNWRLEVNNPLRLEGANVYLLGHGYAPVIRYTDRYGATQTKVAPFLPDDEVLTSSGVAAFPDANVDPDGTRPGERSAQTAFAGVYLPTLPHDPSVGRSAFPAERDPALMLVAYQGDLGLGSGLPQSVYELDQGQIDSGRLRQVGQKMLRPGGNWKLPDGSTVEFLGTQQWVTVSVRHDPGEMIVLVGAGSLLAGLMISLTGRRRRVWARVTPTAGGRSLISLGGLARGDYPGFADEFARVAELAGGSVHDVPRPVAVGEGR
jgi:cytochrome c biogenesis protein